MSETAHEAHRAGNSAGERLLAGRRALITGAGSGIGAATALRFAEDGANVCVCDLDTERLEQVVATLEAAGYQVEALAVDVADEAAVSDVVRRASASLGGLDTVVANAGLFSLGRFEDSSAAELRKVIDVNLVGVFNVFHAAVPELKRAGGGVLLATSSIAGLRGSRLHTVYCASKFAVSGLVECLGLELADQGIRVCAVAPGFTDTAMLPSYIKGRARILDQSEADVTAELNDSIPFGRLAAPAEIANVFAMLASPRASYMTGTTVEVGGGAR
jgi:3-oxoacyl-[acyl-carrier protein] reductase